MPKQKKDNISSKKSKESSLQTKQTIPQKAKSTSVDSQVTVSNEEKRGKYYYAVGRRKEATARIKLYPQGSGLIKVNEKDYHIYFPHFALQSITREPLKETSLEKKFDVSVRVLGGGLKGQAEAVRLGIARALVKFNDSLKPVLRAHGFLTRDARVKERKKYGLKKARRAPQWQKR